MLVFYGLFCNIFLYLAFFASASAILYDFLYIMVIDILFNWADGINPFMTEADII